ncbi:hypothetical protein ABZ461_09525, partial [Actinacidiphila glaucinigra]|uniref:hypothetical protein n=1 Tax=Actinacidiphila glaucinigra TaxID=235986 RepID=UPI0033E26EC0
RLPTTRMTSSDPPRGEQFTTFREDHFAEKTSVSAAADQTGQHLLRIAATLSVQRDPFANAEVISKTTHGVLPPGVEAAGFTVSTW